MSVPKNTSETSDPKPIGYRQVEQAIALDRLFVPIVGGGVDPLTGDLHVSFGLLELPLTDAHPPARLLPVFSSADLCAQALPEAKVVNPTVRALCDSLPLSTTVAIDLRCAWAVSMTLARLGAMHATLSGT